MNPFLPLGNPQEWHIDPTNPNNDAVVLLMRNIITIALDLAGIVAAIYIVIGAFNYLTAFGSEEKATAGKTTLTWAIVGLIIIILAQVAVYEIFNFVTTSAPNLTPFVN